jgi:hypothetical protein
MPAPWLFPLYALALCAAGLGVVVQLSLMKTDGFLVYTLDDPYIHLSVAESILERGYGINTDEYASPSSSILYPYLLAAGLMLGLGTYGPLVISGIFSLLSVWILARFAARVLPDGSGLVPWMTFLIMGIVVVFALNAIALPMNGMEHTIHIFGVVLALTGLYELLVKEDDSQLWAVFLGSLICATIRFEGLALVAGVVLALGLAGHRRTAIALVALVVGVLVAYGSYMTSLGLPPVPSSVMTKSNIASQASEGSLFALVKSVISNFLRALVDDRGVVMGITAAIVVALCLDRKSPVRLRLFFLSVLVLLVGHLLAGRFGWFDRYEIYAVAAMFVLFIAVLRHQGNTTSVLAFAMAALIYASPYGLTAVRSPAASANIYQQQYQMHRFAQNYYPAPVAVNDLGWVAYGNRNYVLDLWGLGSEEARQLTAAGGWTKAKLSEITRRHSIEYAMIYDSWFEEVPDEWCLGAKLITSRVTAASDTVSFYLIDTANTESFEQALFAFRDTLPKGARLEFGTC